MYDRFTFFIPTPFRVFVHQQVTQMTYCKATKIIISADYHGNVVVTSEIQCKLKEVSTKTVFRKPLAVRRRQTVPYTVG